MTENVNPTKVATWLVVGLVALGLLMGVGTWSYGYPTWMGGWGGMMAWGGLMMVVPIAIVVLLVYVLVPRQSTTAQPQDAISTLEARYARGEIGRDEYLRVREDLERRPRS